MRNTAEGIDYSDLHWGKYDSPIAQYISLRVIGNGDWGDEDESDGEGNGVCRFGRRIYWWDDQGFEGCDTYETVEMAQNVFRGVSDRYYAQCDECGESVHNDTESWYEHSKYECEPWYEVSDWPRFEHADYRGVAFRVDRVGIAGPKVGQIVGVMVGDDREYVFDVGPDITPLEDDQYCSECGQIGCGWHSSSN